MELYRPVDIYVVSFQESKARRCDPLGARRPHGGRRDPVARPAHRPRGEDGEVTVREFEEFRDEYGFTVVELEASGVIGDEDIDELAEQIPPGTAGAIMAIELLFAKRLASAFAASAVRCSSVERIPAAVVNEVFAAAADLG